MADLDPGLIAVLIISAFFLVWYYAAFVYSRRLVARIAGEWKEAVLALGGTSKVRRFGTAAFRMTTEGAAAPFREVSATITLRPREMPINWAIGTAQGRRDAALVEAHQFTGGFRVTGARRALAGTVAAAADHRIAMSFGVLAMLPGNGIAVDDRGCVDVSFPGFWSTLERAVA